VKLLPETATAESATRLLLESVIHGVTEVTLRPFRLKVWLVAELLLFMATKTILDGEVVLVSLNALTEIPDVGDSVAPMR
jgi:hypothetical protein